MRLLTIVQGEYGWRIANNVQQNGPADWTSIVWEAPPILPPVIDYPEEYLPEEFPQTDLILSLGQHPGVAELLPDIVAMSGARAVIAPVDNVAWLPPGLMNQVARWLDDLGVTAVFPKPFCSLTETSYNAQRRRVEYDDPLIAEFSRSFGWPEFRVSPDTNKVSLSSVEVVRDTPCGCARHVAEQLTQGGVSLDDAEQAAGLAHHHYPCLAGMIVDPDYSDTLMHVSGNILKDAIAKQAKPHRRPPPYLRPSGRSE